MKNDELIRKAESIWKTSEQIAQLLRNSARLRLRDSRGNILIDKLSEKQNVMVVTVRTLCFEHPEGVLLKTLAAQLGITPASASVMVDALTVSGFLVRRIAVEDRRAVRITVSPKANSFYDTADKAILKLVLQIGERLGNDVLIKWHDVLEKVGDHLKHDL